MATTTQPPRPPQTPPPDRPPARGPHVVLLVLGSLLGLAGLVVASLATATGWAAFAQRDGRFLTSPTERYTVSSYALTTAEMDVLVDEELPAARFPVASLMLRATAADPDRPVFVGVGPRDQVAAYLRDVEHTEVSSVTFYPFRAQYRPVPGTRAPATPGSQTFWAASAEGTGTQTLEMALRSGTWVAVVMNADAERTVSVDLAAGARTTLLGPITLGLAVGALVLLGAGVALLLWGASGLGRATASTPGSVGGTTALSAAGPGGVIAPATAPTLGTPAAGIPPATVPPYPARLTGDLEPVSRWLWLVKWVLIIPHLLVLALLWIALVGTTIVAGVAILFTGRYPRGLFDFSVGVLRWSWRVGFYAYSAIGTDRYPPFTLARTDYPADFDVDYPERLSHGLVLVKSWLLAIPHLIIVGLLTAPWYWVVNGSPTSDYQRSVGISLLGLLVLVAGLALLFTDRYPRALFELIMGINRWVYRVATYVLLLRDEYPPFRLDQGAREPGTAAGPVDTTPPGASAAPTPDQTSASPGS